MAAKTRRSSKSRKPRLTEAEREARREAEAALMDASSELLDDGEAGAELVAFLMGRPALARLSVRNVALLAVQAEQRGTEVTDVRTYNQWKALGRQVTKGSKSYQLIVPTGMTEAKKDEAETPADQPSDDQGGNEGGEERKPRFRFKSAWFDISQTEGIEGEPAAGPVEVSTEQH